MLVTGILILTGVIGRLGKYLPAQSISGFLFVIGMIMTFIPNLSTVASSDGSMSGFIALGVTAWSKNPFLGMVAGILVKFFGSYVGL
jgi:AGZA family xanthine/uracil permease-like MFS transporter